MTKRYVRTGRTAKKIAKREENKKEIEALSHISEPVIPESPKTVQKTISSTFAETFEKKFNAISRAVRQNLATAQKIHAHIEQLPEEQYREKLHRESSEITNQLITDLITELDALSTTIPPEATTLRKTVENYREPLINLISHSVKPEETPNIFSHIIDSDPCMKNWLEEFTTLRHNVRFFITETLKKYTALTRNLAELKSQLPENESELKNALDNYESFLDNLIPSGPENTATEENTLSVSPTPRPGG